jgi:hypothetical protein
LQTTHRLPWWVTCRLLFFFKKEGGQPFKKLNKNKNKLKLVSASRLFFAFFFKVEYKFKWKKY